MKNEREPIVPDLYAVMIELFYIKPQAAIYDVVKNMVHVDEDDDESLIYYNIEEDRFITLLEDFGTHSHNPKYYPDMVWSPARTLFAYTSFNEVDGITELFIWGPDLGESVLVYTEESEQRIFNLTWSPDSDRLYFSARTGLLAYQVADQRLIVIAETGR